MAAWLRPGQVRWTGIYNSNSVPTRVQPRRQLRRQVGAPGGSQGGGSSSANNANPVWVPGPPGTATTTGQVYTGSTFDEASIPGEKITLGVKETTPSGTTVGTHTTTVTPSDTSWHQITSAYTAGGTGNLIRYSLYASNFASTAQHFLADCLSLQTP